MAVLDQPLPGDAAKARELRRMQAIATGLLALMAVVYVMASLYRGAWPWLGYVRAFAEAGMVGACADWFAVSALFRRPLGLPIPHTGIIPRNKDRIGEALGGFIANNFLTVEVLDARIRQLELARWGGEWLRAPNNARRLARRLASFLPELLSALPPEALRETAASVALAAGRAIPAAPTASKVLAAAWSEGRSRAVIDWGLDRAAAWLSQNREAIQAGVEARSYRWMPKFVDRMIAEKVTSGLAQTLEDIRAPDHPWRLEIDVAVRGFIDRLAHDPELAAQGEALKLRLLDDPRLHEQARGLWDDIEVRLLAGRSEAAAHRLEALLLALGEWLCTDEGAQAKLNAGARIVARRLIAPRRHEIGGFVAQVVASWDVRSIVDKLELQVGKDLQYIRVNGTLVGGLVGLLIYALSQALGLH